MGYVFRVKLASFFAGVATASFAALYLLNQDFKVFNQSTSQQIKGLHKTLDERITMLEKLKEVDGASHVETTE